MNFEDLGESEQKLLLKMMNNGVTSPSMLPDLACIGGNAALSDRLMALDYDDLDRLWLRLFDSLYPVTPAFPTDVSVHS